MVSSTLFSLHSCPVSSDRPVSVMIPSTFGGDGPVKMQSIEFRVLAVLLVAGRGIRLMLCEANSCLRIILSILLGFNLSKFGCLPL